MRPEPGDCSRVFAKIERERAETLAELERWPPGRALFRPALDTWSAVEVLDHVVRVESGTMVDVRMGLRNLQILGTEERPGIAALESALRSEGRFAVPPGAEAIYPDAQTSLVEVADRWEQTRMALAQLLEEIGPSETVRGVFCHPFAGWMTIVDVMDHFSAHLYHHRFQLARLRAGWTAEQDARGSARESARTRKGRKP